MGITQFPSPPTTISGTVTVAAGPSPLTVQLDLAPTDDDGNPYVSLWPDSDPPTGTMQEVMRRLLAQIAAATPPMQPPTTAISQITANGQIIGPFTLSGQNAAQVFLYGIYTSATVIYEVSQDGITWLAKRSIRHTGVQDSQNGLALGANSAVASAIDVSGWLYFRVRCSAFGAAGTVNVVVAAYGSFTPANVSVTAAGVSAIGSAPADRPVMIGGIDGSGFARYLSLDATGQLNVNQGTAGGTPWPVSISGLVTTTAPTQPTAVIQDGQTTDDDGNPYVSLWPDSDPPTGTMQEANRRLLAQIATVQPATAPIVPIIVGIVQNGQIAGPYTLNGANVVCVAMSGTYASATLIDEVSQDGVTWIGKRGVRNSGLMDNLVGVALGANSTLYHTIDVSGFVFYRCRCSAFGASGTLNLAISVYSTFATPTIAAVVTGVNAAGANAVGNPIIVGGSDGGGLARYFSTDTTGRLNANIQPATTTITGTAAVSTGVTLTIPAAGAGLFNYLVALEISLYVSASVTGAATPILVTTTGITGTPTYSVAAGTSAVVGALLDRILLQLGNPLQGSAVNTAMVFTAPVVTNAIWRLTAYYYTGP